MATTDNKPAPPYRLTILVVIATIAVAAALYLSTKPGAPPSPSPPAPIDPWSGAPGARLARVSLTRQGPRVEFGAGEIAIGFSEPGTWSEWSVERSGALRKARATWRAEGTVLRIELEARGASPHLEIITHFDAFALPSDLRLTLRGPGVLSPYDASAPREQTCTPLSAADQNGDALWGIVPAYGTPCALDEGAPARISFPVASESPRAQLTLGAPPPAHVVPWPRGTKAAALLIFRLEEGDEPSLGEEDRRRRARAILYGHSDPKDARYGNGGVLGARLSAGLASAPETPPLGLTRASQISEIAGRSVARAAGELRFTPASTWPVGLPLIKSVFAADAPRLIVEIAEDSAPIARLVGALEPNAIATLAQRGGVYGAGIPVRASRDPLVSWYDQAALRPERGGHWSLHPQIEIALEALEASGGRVGEVAFITPARALRAWRAARALQVRWRDPSGALIVETRAGSHPPKDSAGSVAFEFSSQGGDPPRLEARPGATATLREGAPRPTPILWTFEE